MDKNDVVFILAKYKHFGVRGIEDLFLEGIVI